MKKFALVAAPLFMGWDDQSAVTIVSPEADRPRLRGIDSIAGGPPIYPPAPLAGVKTIGILTTESSGNVAWGEIRIK